LVPFMNTMLTAEPALAKLKPVEVNETKQNSISGKVMDSDGNPISGATVTNLQSQQATQTDFDGNFILQGAVGDRLSASFIGFETLTLSVDEVEGLILTLQYSDNVLEE